MLMKVLLPRFINWLKLLVLKVLLFVILEFYSMARYLSSVSVVLSPKAVQEIGPMKSFTISLDCVSGSTIFHAMEYICKHPLIKGLLHNYCIINCTFKYSEL